MSPEPMTAEPETKRPHLFLATPCYGGQLHATFALSLLLLQGACRDLGIPLHVQFITSDSLITRARNRLAAIFRRHGESTHLVMIDADIGFDPRTLLRMVAADHDVCVGLCPYRETDWQAVADAARAGVVDPAELRAASGRVVVSFDGPRPVLLEAAEGLRFFDVDHGGTGVMIIKRSALERVIAHCGPSVEYLEDPREGGGERWALFQASVDPVTGRYLSEDWHFSGLVRAAGMRVMACADAAFSHTGPATFEADPSGYLASRWQLPAAEPEPQSASPATPVVMRSRRGPCPCGSGKRWNRCHGAGAGATT